MKLRKRVGSKSWRGPEILHFVGIDVSKKSLDVCMLSAQNELGSRRFENTAKGFEELLAWCAKKGPLSSCHFCLESTGTYGLGIASFLSDRQLLVSVENPRFVKHHALSEGIQNKTDKADARIIACYCQERAPRSWTLRNPLLRELDLLLHRLAEVSESRLREENRLECAFLPERVRESVLRVVHALREEWEALAEAIQTELARMPELLSKVRALVKEPGVGELTALRALSHFGWDVSHFSHAQRAAAAAGLNPVVRQSGTWKGKTRISKQGDPGFRAELHMAAVTAARYNPEIKAFYERMLAKGLCKLAAITACARKLLMRLFGILRAHTQGENPTYAATKTRFTNIQGKQRVLEPKPEKK